MTGIKRRRFLKMVSAAPVAGGLLGGCGEKSGQMDVADTGVEATAPALGKQAAAHVVVIGGGFGGATAAKYIRQFSANSVDVTLVEPKQAFVTCPGSNWVLGGLRDMNFITHSYASLQNKHGVTVVHDRATSIDADTQQVTLAGGDILKYDRLVVSPGIAFRDNVEGYTTAAMEKIPHAWQAGPQTTLLRQQLEAMPDGGTVIMAAPPNPFRCPPGPPERASMIAGYLQKYKPKSKVLILDAKDKFSKQGLFIEGWTQHYGYGTDNSLIEWIPASQDGAVQAVDVKGMKVMTGFAEHPGDVINIIPAQKAGDIAAAAGLTDDSGWCPVDHLTWESTLIANVHVIGDAAIQSPLPKSGYAANSEAKVCAANIVRLLEGESLLDPSWINTCYSLITQQHGISVAMVYALVDGKVAKVEGAGGVSKSNDPPGRALEASYAVDWYQNITYDIFG
jgi:sulfide dehydrogenase [flavocytochrome c] flavoprotein subunit